jgi:hypothetical protein
MIAQRQVRRINPVMRISQPARRFEIGYARAQAQALSNAFGCRFSLGFQLGNGILGAGEGGVRSG